MARDGNSDALGANQSKKTAASDHDLGDQPQQQHPPQQQHHRAKSQKHVVGGAAGGRLHARIPSSKALHKHHAAPSTAKLNRKHGSLSPDRGTTTTVLASHQQHRRATSELKLPRDSSSTNLKRNTSQTLLKRNRSHVDVVGKRTKSSTALNRSASNPAVHKLRSSGSSKVQFNLGDEDPDDGPDDAHDEDEWVDASTSASPLLSRRGSAVSSAHTANHATEEDEAEPTASSPTHRPLRNGTRSGAQGGTTNGTHQSAVSSPPQNKPATHNQYLTSRILSRTPSHGAPPMMSAEHVSARPPSLRQQSPTDSSLGQGQYLPNTPGAAAQVRPGSSGKAELTSRFVGNNSQEPGSGLAGESFILAAQRGGLSRAATNGKDSSAQPKRRQSLGGLSQTRGIDAISARRAAASELDSDDDDDDDDRMSRRSRSRRSGEYNGLPTDMNRTQQKLNLQRASSTLEPTHPHPGLGMLPPGVAAAAGGSLVGVPTTYDSRDPRVTKMLERTGTEYLTVRRHLNPVARSVWRVMQLPGLENSRRIPPPNGTGPRHHTSRPSEQFYRSHQREPTLTRNSSMADLINGGGGTGSSTGRRPPTPRSSSGGVFSALQSASSSLGTDDGGGAGRLQAAAAAHGQGHGHGQGLSGSSLVDGAEDAGTLAMLRMMWDKNMDLRSNQD
ncbi:hypothetical protein C8A05DRAFT_18206 [Staphylotrichum tortipilum]|uniref:Uncharacterized protein n=1 Tax=Staphylotrichum tortipilum TaxID=2831512 RepID=A0AAN6MG69_9PEZI|nr:hypothetical protein C8A05DRAFT_18206 [Staphylotrichum longicolle]